MRKQSLINDIIVLMITGLFLAGFGWYISRKQIVNNINITDNRTTNKNEELVKEKTNSDLISGSIIGLKSTDNHKSIVLTSITDGKTKVIYTDSDEKKKITSIIGQLDSDIIFTENFSNNIDLSDLVSISTEGKLNKKIIQTDISLSSNPIIKPNSSEILILSFSPIEKDFGFSLSLSKVDGTNKKTIIKNVKSILSPKFSPSGDFIIYASLIDKKSQLNIIDLNGQVVKNINFDGTILDIVWLKSGIIISRSDNKIAGANQGSLIFLDDNLNNLKNLKDQEGAEIDLVPISDKLIAFRRVKFKSGVATPLVTGDLILLDIESNEEKKITSLNQINGYLK